MTPINTTLTLEPRQAEVQTCYWQRQNHRQVCLWSPVECLSATCPSAGHRTAPQRLCNIPVVAFGLLTWFITAANSAIFYEYQLHPSTSVASRLMALTGVVALPQMLVGMLANGTNAAAEAMPRSASHFTTVAPCHMFDGFYASTASHTGTLAPIDSTHWLVLAIVVCCISYQAIKRLPVATGDSPTKRRREASAASPQTLKSVHLAWIGIGVFASVFQFSGATGLPQHTGYDSETPPGFLSDNNFVNQDPDVDQESIEVMDDGIAEKAAVKAAGISCTSFKQVAIGIVLACFALSSTAAASTISHSALSLAVSSVAGNSTLVPSRLYLPTLVMFENAACTPYCTELSGNACACINGCGCDCASSLQDCGSQSSDAMDTTRPSWPFGFLVASMALLSVTALTFVPSLEVGYSAQAPCSSLNDADLVDGNGAQLHQNLEKKTRDTKNGKANSRVIGKSPASFANIANLTILVIATSSSTAIASTNVPSIPTEVVLSVPPITREASGNMTLLPSQLYLPTTTMLEHALCSGSCTVEDGVSNCNCMKFDGYDCVACFNSGGQKTLPISSFARLLFGASKVLPAYAVGCDNLEPTHTGTLTTTRDVQPTAILLSSSEPSAPSSLATLAHLELRQCLNVDAYCSSTESGPTVLPEGTEGPAIPLRSGSKRRIHTPTIVKLLTAGLRAALIGRANAATLPATTTLALPHATGLFNTTEDNDNQCLAGINCGIRSSASRRLTPGFARWLVGFFNLLRINTSHASALPTSAYMASNASHAASSILSERNDNQCLAGINCGTRSPAPRIRTSDFARWLVTGFHAMGIGRVRAVALSSPTTALIKATPAPLPSSDRKNDNQCLAGINCGTHSVGSRTLGPGFARILVWWMHASQIVRARHVAMQTTTTTPNSIPTAAANLTARNDNQCLAGINCGTRSAGAKTFAPGCGWILPLNALVLIVAWTIMAVVAAQAVFSTLVLGESSRGAVSMDSGGRSEARKPINAVHHKSWTGDQQGDPIDAWASTGSIAGKTAAEISPDMPHGVQNETTRTVERNQGWISPDQLSTPAPHTQNWNVATFRRSSIAIGLTGVSMALLAIWILL